jgi:ubiquinone/menaquinone biosynthesis C-methylase UbiE
MNKAHLEFCSSDEWAEGVRKWIIPGALANVDLGDHVLEVGPGPGRTTEVLKDMAPRLTAVEIDTDLAAKLGARISDVNVVHGDGTSLPFPNDRFSAALSFTMLHHVPSVEQQDMLFTEVARVLRPGGVFAGCDSHDTPEWRQMHIDDICVPIEPSGLDARLRSAGFADVTVDDNPYVVQFWARV